ncbi:hypothetical protein [Neolewinella antarctica]|uniref:Uncharacterized protein n=1 Tax=Neolewinella antarctica TaxID=442734 RepID=A0ABX0XD66_9BACT|nr:hypothetical protein [Neolewinella antarctica]NJC27020.1 hypothetical protein [Neolewinella antarctica]
MQLTPGTFWNVFPPFKRVLPLLFLLPLSVVAYGQTSTVATATHIFWSPDHPLRQSDYSTTVTKPDPVKHCQEIGLCWGASVVLFSVLDEPKRKRDQGKMLEKVYFAPAFCKDCSYALNDNTLDFLTQQIVFDLYELNARKNRRDLAAIYDQSPSYGIATVMFKTVERDNELVRKKIIAELTQEVYVKDVPGAYEKWRIIVDDLLLEMTAFATTEADRMRFITDEPLSGDYRKAETVIGTMKVQ